MYYKFNIDDLQGKVSRQFCSPVFDRDSIIRSFACKGKFNLVLFGKTKGSDKVFSNEDGKLLMYMLNSNGLKIQP